MKKLEFPHVLFFGRTLQEYLEMFGLDLGKWIGLEVLDCPGGPSSFVAEAREQGVLASACDPAYEKGPQQMLVTGHGDYRLFLGQQLPNPDSFDQAFFQDPTKFEDNRLRALGSFVKDYEQHQDQRYFNGALPCLPWCKDNSYDLVLSANLLFVYTTQTTGGFLEESSFDYEFHLKSMMELVRVCSKEVRIYPLKGPNNEGPYHPYLEDLRKDLERFGVRTELLPIPYQGLKDANEALLLYK